MPTPKEYVATDGTSTWRVRFRNGSRQTTETFDTHVQALAFCNLVDTIGAAAAVQQRELTDRTSGEYVPLVAELLEQHVDELTGVDSATRDEYRALARRTWLPIIGAYRIDQVTRAVVAHVVNSLDGRLSPKSIKNAHSLLSGVLQTAVYRDLIPTNPARGTRLPRAGEEDVEEIRFLGYSEFDQLLAATTDRWRPFVITLFGTGLRFSEATALQVQDVDLVHRTLRVMRAWKKGGRIGPPKSKASRRTIALPVEVVDALRPLVAGRAGSAWIFTTRTGMPVTHSNFFNRVWKPATVRVSVCPEHADLKCRCGTPKPWQCPLHRKKDEHGHQVLVAPCECPGTVSPRPRIHDARHTHASWLIAQGVRLEVVQDRLGHESYLTTKQVYGHLMPDLRTEAGLAASLAFASTTLGRRQLEGGSVA